MKVCTTCGSELLKLPRQSYKQFKEQKYCSRECKAKVHSVFMTGNKFAVGGPGFSRKHTVATKRLISQKKKQNPTRYWLGKKRAPETVEKMRSYARTRKGETSGRWIADRTALAKSDRKSSHTYRVWRDDVKKRDGEQCCLCSSHCRGRLEVHHIIPWRENKLLRYVRENGITLCEYHHPRGAINEKRMMPMLAELTGLHLE